MLITNALRVKPLRIYGSGQNIHDWIFVDDECAANLTVLEKGEKGQIYNIGGGNERKNLEIAKEILHCLSLPETMIEFVADRPGHDFRYSIQCSKVQHLGWKPQVGFEEGLQRTVDWYSDQRVVVATTGQVNALGILQWLLEGSPLVLSSCFEFLQYCTAIGAEPNGPSSPTIVG